MNCLSNVRVCARGRLASFALLAFVVGCSGDDTAGAPLDGGGDAADATTDGAAADGAMLTDGAMLADSSLATDGSDGSLGSGDASDAALDAPSDASIGPQLSCTTWRYPSPITLETLGVMDDAGSGDAGAVAYTSSVWVTSPAPGQVRVVAQPSVGPVFRLYGVDKSTSAVTTLDGPTMDVTSIVSVHPFSVGTSHVSEILVNDESSVPPPATELFDYLIDDTMPMTGPLPSPIALSIGFAGAVAIPFSSSSVFDAVDYIESAGGATTYYGLGVGLATSTQEATLSLLSSSDHNSDFAGLAAVHANGSVYVYASNDPSHAGESMWQVPDDAGVPDQFAPAAFDMGENGRMIDVTPSADAGAANMAYVAMPADGGSNSLLATQVAPSGLASLTASSLAVARSYGDAWLTAAAPTAAWHGDDLMLIAPASLGGGSGTGVRLLWVNAAAVVRGEQMGAGTILQDRTGIVSVNASPASVTATTAAWDVAWIESHTDGTSALLYNELDCQ